MSRPPETTTYKDPNTGEIFYWSPPDQCYIYPASNRRWYPGQPGPVQGLPVPAGPSSGPAQPRSIPVPPKINNNSTGFPATSPPTDPNYRPVPGRAPSNARTQPSLAASPPGPQSLVDSFGRLNTNTAGPSNALYGGQQEGIEQGTNIRYNVRYGPPSAITDPDLLKAGYYARKYVGATEGESEYLDPSFKKRDKPRRWFTFGKVFLVLWAEPAGPGSDNVTEVTRDVRFHQPIHSKIRRFVVIREGSNYCSALSINSYSNQGVAKRGLMKSEHAIIYTGREAPEPTAAEAARRGEDPMRSRAIRVDTHEPTDKLSPMSRINFGKVYTVEHNVKAKGFGNVTRTSENALRQQFRDVWNSGKRKSKADTQESSEDDSNDEEDQDDESDDDEDDDDDDAGDEAEKTRKHKVTQWLKQLSDAARNDSSQTNNFVQALQSAAAEDPGTWAGPLLKQLQALAAQQPAWLPTLVAELEHIVKRDPSYKPQLVAARQQQIARQQEAAKPPEPVRVQPAYVTPGTSAQPRYTVQGEPPRQQQRTAEYAALAAEDAGERRSSSHPRKGKKRA